MDEHRIEEQAELLRRAQIWDAAECACGIAAALLLPLSVVLSNALSERLGVDVALLRLAFTILPVIWVAVMAFCSMRAKKCWSLLRGEKR